MKAIILSAGQGSRLLPLTEDCPKCLLPVGDRSALELQIDHLYAAGVRDIVVVVGFLAGVVENKVATIQKPGLAVRTLFNPFFDVSDNLATCWMAREEMDGPFMVLNGDTMFEPAICEKLLQAPAAPITMAVDFKAAYDADDMKVRLDGDRVLEVDKSIELSAVDGESIGMLLFRGEGPGLFRGILDQEMRKQIGIKRFYLKAISVLAEQGCVAAQSIKGLKWGEIDFPEDLAYVQTLFAGAPVRR
jgi:choline kinase